MIIINYDKQTNKQSNKQKDKQKMNKPTIKPGNKQTPFCLRTNLLLERKMNKNGKLETENEHLPKNRKGEQSLASQGK